MKPEIIELLYEKKMTQKLHHKTQSSSLLLLLLTVQNLYIPSLHHPIPQGVKSTEKTTYTSLPSHNYTLLPLHTFLDTKSSVHKPIDQPNHPQKQN